MGGVVCEPKKMSSAEKARMTRAFVAGLSDLVGPSNDVLFPEANTDAQVMAWALSEYERHRGLGPAMATGKPLIMQGCEGRQEASGFGLLHMLQQLLLRQGLDLRRRTCVVAGFGKVGQHAALGLAEKGVRVVGIGDSHSGVVNPDGLDLLALLAHKKERGVVQGFSPSLEVSCSDLLSHPCEILIFAGVGPVFDVTAAERVKCKYMVEAANVPSTFEAGAVFKERGVIVVPDIMATGGGAIASYFEWAQNMQHFRWKRVKVMKEQQLPPTSSTAG
jgi:glutamate dehydrogenase/leucine dehydrogenase